MLHSFPASLRQVALPGYQPIFQPRGHRRHGVSAFSLRVSGLPQDPGRGADLHVREHPPGTW